LAAVSEALNLIEQTDEKFYQAELYRLEGELTLRQANSKVGANANADAANSFRRAIEIAKRQQAKGLNYVQR
jgi:hypothetical protein